MVLNRGIRTSEFWLSSIAAIITVLMPLLVAYGVLDTERGEMWAALILAVASIVVPIVVGSIARNYNDGRTEIKLQAIGLETQQAMLAAARFERVERLEAAG